MNENEFYTSKEVQKILHISAVTLCMWRKRNYIDFIKLGPRKILYRKTDIDNFLDSKHVQRGE